MKINDKNFINKINELASDIIKGASVNGNANKELIKAKAMAITTLCDVVDPCDDLQYLPQLVSAEEIAPNFSIASMEQHD